ncbi:hypothetical protein [Rhodoferax ferrireducens]|uniref:hypothetical protein n=1 Tax=Rhodoferax ferrireducens TaxID=192843 RepID=UPI000E0D7EC3|nr:hypothetical protein [Rhodoferax ferrireducens]
MLTQTKIAFLISALVAGTTFASSASATSVADQPIAREASEGARGEGGKKGGHPAIETKEQLARNGADDAAGDDHGGRRGGRSGRGGRG